MHQLIHDTESVSPVGGHDLTSEDNVQRRSDSDQPRKALASAGGWYDAELDFREPQGRLWMVRGNAVRTRERRFQPTSQARTVNGCHHRLVQLAEPADQSLPAAHELQRFVARFQSDEFVDVSTGDEAVPLSRQENDRANVGIATQLVEQRLQFVPHAGGDLVDGFVW